MQYWDRTHLKFITQNAKKREKSYWFKGVGHWSCEDGRKFRSGARDLCVTLEGGGGGETSGGKVRD